jgi:hypothetical protein
MSLEQGLGLGSSQLFPPDGKTVIIARHRQKDIAKKAIETRKEGVGSRSDEGLIAPRRGVCHDNATGASPGG